MSLATRQIWCDGSFIPWEEAKVHVLSQSMQRGTLVFDYFSIHQTSKGPAIFRLPEHVDRLIESCRLVQLPLTLTRQELIEACMATAIQNPGASSLKASVLIPSVEVDIVPQDYRVSVYIAAYDSHTDIISRNQGEFHVAREISLMIERDKKNRRQDIMPPQAKVASNYTATMVAKLKARAAGYDEILLLDEKGYVAEAPTSNIFMVSQSGVLKTPPADKVLHGITRATLLEVARRQGMQVEETDILPEELFTAEEVFLSATSVGVWPVVSIDGISIGGGKKGPVATALLSRFRSIVAGDDAEFEHWLTYLQAE